MQRKQVLSTFIVGALLMTSCGEQIPIITKEESNPQQEVPATESPNIFPKADNSTELKGYPAERLLSILKSKTFNEIMPLGETIVSESELSEIKEFTDNLIKESKATTPKEKHDAIFKWITKNVKYGRVYDPSIPNYNSAYTSFKYKDAICQGYSHLLKAMCYTQQINAPVVNGLARFYGNGELGGHAWNYVHLDGQWYVSDATNAIFYPADDKTRFDFLLPKQIDFTLWQDDKMTYIYHGAEITVSSIHKQVKDSKIIVPYSIGGFKITNFNPDSIPNSVSEIYIGSNIKMLGTDDNRKLKNFGNQIEKIGIDPANKYIEEYNGAIYKKQHEANDKKIMPIFIPGKLRVIKLKPVQLVEKNTIYNHQGVRQLYFGEGTEEIEDSAIEGCPNIEIAYIPKSVKKINKNAFRSCNSKLKIVHL